MKKLIITTFIFSLFFSFGLSFAQEATSTPIERFYAWESTTFTEKTWQSMTSTGDGSKVAIINTLQTSGTGVKTGGYIYVSDDGGYSWNMRSSSLGQKDWRVVKYSEDGNTLVAAAAGFYDYIYISKDNGQTWATSTGAGKRQWTSLAVSSDGKNIVAGDYGQYLYISSDSGVTWNTIETLGMKGWRNITLAQNGSKIIVTISNDYLYISSDSGATWATSTELGVKNWKSLSSSEDGSKIAITEFFAGNVFISHDSGQSWATSSPVIGQNYWRDITFSQDGSKIIVANENNYIYTSSDSGLTWIEQSAVGSRKWDSVTISKDGNKMFAAANATYSGGLYVYGPIPLIISNTKAVVSKNSQISFLGTANYTYNIRGVDYCVREALNTPCAYTEQFLENGSYPVGGFSMIMDNLSPGAYYQYRIFIEDAEGRVYSQDSVIHLDYTAWTSLTQITDKTWIYKYLSADGNNMKLVSTEGEIYTSSDSGNTWDISLDSSLKKFASITSSLDGNKVVAIDREDVDGNGGYIYTSLDSGTTWATSTEAGLRRWRSIRSSFDGSKLLASDYSENLYVSNNFGESWSIKNLSTKIGNIDPYGVAAYLSASGTKMIVINAGFIWTSSDDGETWSKSTASLGQKNWGNVSISADGNKIFASIGTYGYIYTSSDGGQTWSTVTALGQDFWRNISMSADGNILYATPIGYDGGYYKIHTYKSIDGGTTWTEELKMGRVEWNSTQISYDGGKILGFGKYVYVYMTPKAPIIFENGVPTSPDRYSLNLPVYINTLSTAYGIEYCNSGTSTEECFEKVVNIQSGSNYLGGYYVNLNNITSGYYHYRFFAENNEGRTYSSQYMKLVQQNDWYPIPGTEDMNWEQIVVSDDGKYLLIAETYGDVLRSSDYGETWIKTSLPSEWHASVAGSSDGKYLAVLGRYLHLSSDYGQSWTTSGLEVPYGAVDINMTDDGKNLILAVYNDYVQTSSDYGASWKKIESLGKKQWYQTAITDTKDGLIMIAIDVGLNSVFISRDGGEVWEENLSLKELYWWGEPGAISFSNDGQDIFIAPDSNYIYKSSDYGETWQPLTESGQKTWVAITSSSDGQKVVAIADEDYIYNSIDGGQTWIEQTNVPMVSWQTVASSASGEYIFAAAYDGTPIYKYANALPQAKNVSAVVTR